MYDRARAPHRIVRRAVATVPVAWLSARVLHRLDRVVHRVTRRRATLSAWASGLPVVMLTTRGARTGQAREVPVVALPDGDRLVLIASNFGQRHHPAWYHNLRAHPQAVVDGREYEAHELTGEERERQFQYGVQIYPGWLRYRERAANREIPVIRLIPMDAR